MLLSSMPNVVVHVTVIHTQCCCCCSCCCYQPQEGSYYWKTKEQQSTKLLKKVRVNVPPAIDDDDGLLHVAAFGAHNWMATIRISLNTLMPKTESMMNKNHLLVIWNFEHSSILTSWLIQYNQSPTLNSLLIQQTTLITRICFNH